MLRDVFPVLVPGGTPESPLIWESSRFAINPAILSEAERAVANHVVNRTTVELLCGIVEVCQRAGIEHIVSVVHLPLAFTSTGRATTSSGILKHGIHRSLSSGSRL